MRAQFTKSFAEVISPDNLLAAWHESLVGKQSKSDAQLFGRQLMDNILRLHTELANRQYRHSGYYRFGIADPKPREIHKASVRDRVLNHAIYR